MKIDRIKSRAKEQGISLSYICTKLGLARVYFNDIEKNKKDIPAERLVLIANILQTTPDYLLGKTDIKEKVPSKTEKVDNQDIRVALFGGDQEVTDDEWEEVQRFVDFVKSKRKNKWLQMLYIHLLSAMA